MKQRGLGELAFGSQKNKTTRKAQFLTEMEHVVPWNRLQSLIEPYYPKGGNGRPPMPLSAMLRIHFMQQWFGYSDPAMEEALYDMPLLRQFAGLDGYVEALPDESTILRFRHLLEKHQLATAIFQSVNAELNERGLMIKTGSAVDATLIDAASSTKNKDKKRDPAMSQTKKGNQYYFGLKAHIGVDLESGLIHSACVTTAKVADNTMLADCVHGEEVVIVADRGYHQKNRTLDHLEAEDGRVVVTPDKKPPGGELTERQKQNNRALASIRAVVEHPFRVLKRQFGYTKARYRGLEKNTGQILTLFALVNLWKARKPLMEMAG